MSYNLIKENVELKNLGSFDGQTVSDLDDVRRLSLYATLRADDLKGLELGGGKLKKKPSPRKDYMGVSLEDLFIQQQPIKYTGETIQEESSSSESLSHDDDSTEIDLVVQDEHKIQYEVKGIKNYEYPVIGFHLDNRVCPGFKYNVRYLGSNRQVFEGEPRVLLSIGMGYGKRLTFRGNQFNLNDCYFWTDNHPEGYGFSISVINKGDNFMIYDSMNQRIGDATIESILEPQVEESMTCSRGEIQKHVYVKFTCSIRYHNKFENALIDITNQDLQNVEGLAEVVKSRKSKEASVVCIKHIKLSKFGKCTFWNEKL